jgi:hypothetical protein
VLSKPVLLVERHEDFFGALPAVATNFAFVVGGILDIPADPAVSRKPSQS